MPPMTNLEIRYEIATQRAAMFELIHRLEKLYDACVEQPPREVIHTRRVICTECAGISPDHEPEPRAPHVDVFGTEIQVTPMEAEIMAKLLAGKPVSWGALRHALFGGGLRPASARKDYVDNEMNNLRAYIAHLRKKLREAGAPAEIVSEWGWGVDLKKVA